MDSSQTQKFLNNCGIGMISLPARHSCSVKCYIIHWRKAFGEQKRGGRGGSRKGTSSSLFQEQSTTAMPLVAIKSASSLETTDFPLGLRMIPGKVAPNLNSSTNFILTNRVPVHRFLLQCPKSHMASLQSLRG